MTASTTEKPAGEGTRNLLKSAFDAAVKATHPDYVLQQHLPPPRKGRVIILAAGKAAAALAANAETYYIENHDLSQHRLVGLAATRPGHTVPTRFIEVIEAGHPVPNSNSVMAASKTMALAKSANHDDLVVVLLSGGGSAAWTLPLEGVSLEQKQRVTKALLRSGAAISEINLVRKHLSQIKGGGLAGAASAAKIVTFAISDVPGDVPGDIASGPTTFDRSPPKRALEILAQYGIDTDQNLVELLSTPSIVAQKAAGHDICDPVIIARPGDGIDAAAELLASSGYRVVRLGDNLEGEARLVARKHAELVRAAAFGSEKLALLSGGELTVTVSGEGRGGPNQEYALALLIETSDLKNISMLSADTDGADGGGGHPRDPAGAFFDAGSLERAQRLGLAPADFLVRNDATSFFELTDDLLITGPTLTNVNDLRIILIHPLGANAP